MIRVLPYYYDLYILERCQSECIEYLIHGRIYPLRGIFSLQKPPEIQIVLLMLFNIKKLLPVVSYVYHILDDSTGERKRHGKKKPMP